MSTLAHRYATLLNSSDNPDKYPENGRHTIDLFAGVFPTDPKVMEETATALNNSPTYLPAVGAHTGSLPTEGSFLQHESDGCVITSLAAAGEGCFACGCITSKIPHRPARWHLTARSRRLRWWICRITCKPICRLPTTSLSGTCLPTRCAP